MQDKTDVERNKIAWCEVDEEEIDDKNLENINQIFDVINNMNDDIEQKIKDNNRMKSIKYNKNN